MATQTIKIREHRLNADDEYDIIHRETQGELVILENRKTVQDHVDTDITANYGVHGIRFNIDDRKLEVWNDDEQEWEEIKTGGSGIPIGNVTNLNVQLANQRLILTWGDPDDIIIDGMVMSVWGGTMVRYKTSPWLPTDDERAGILVVDNISRDAYVTTGYAHEDLTNGTTYYYKLFPRNEDGRVTNDSANEISGTPVGVPAQVTNSQFIVLDRAFALSWTNPTPADYWTKTVLTRQTTGYSSSPTVGVIAEYEGVTLNTDTYNDTGLTAGQTYYYRWFTLNSVGLYSTSGFAELSIAARQNPSQLTGFAAVTGYEQNTLSWSNPSDTNRAGIIVVWNTTHQPASPTDGTIIQLSATATSYAHTGLTNETTYYYTLFAYNIFPADSIGNTRNFSLGVSSSAKPSRIIITNTPTQSGTLTYNGSSQSPTWNNYDSAKMTLGGTTSSTDAGTFNATFTPTAMYKWSDGTTTAKTVSWTIGKAAGSLSISPTTLTLDSSNLTKTIAVTRVGDGAISAVSTNTAVATVSVSGTTVTVSHVNQTTGTATITVSVAAGTNHTAPVDQTCAVTATFIPAHNKMFNSNTWAQITAVSNYIEANNLTTAQVATTFGWNIGDIKTVVMSGTNYILRIIGFNHDNKTSGGKAGITLDMQHSYGTATSARRYMNSSNTNNGGWTSSYMRQTVMPELKALLPSDLQSAIKPVNKLTSQGNNVSTISTTSDGLFLLSEIEIFGATTYSFAGEGSQYAWYSSNNTNADRIKQQPSGTNYGWWERSPYSGNTTHFCGVNSNGGAFGGTASNAYGVSFGLCV